MADQAPIPPESGPPRRPAAPFRRTGILLLPLGVVLLGVGWGQLASWGPDWIPTCWGLTASLAFAMLFVDWVRSLLRPRDAGARRFALLRPALVAATFAVIAAEPFEWMDSPPDVAIATTIVLPMTLALWSLIRSGAVLTSAALIVFVVSSVACIFYNANAARHGIGFFSIWID